jgi:hypothetical protein
MLNKVLIVFAVSVCMNNCLSIQQECKNSCSLCGALFAICVAYHLMGVIAHAPQPGGLILNIVQIFSSKFAQFMVAIRMVTIT